MGSSSDSDMQEPCGGAELVSVKEEPPDTSSSESSDSDSSDSDFKPEAEVCFGTEWRYLITACENGASYYKNCVLSCAVVLM